MILHQERERRVPVQLNDFLEKEELERGKVKGKRKLEVGVKPSKE